MTDKLDFEMNYHNKNLVIREFEWKKYTKEDDMKGEIFLAHKLKDACRAIDLLREEVGALKNQVVSQNER